MPASSICDDLSNGGVLVGVSVSGSVLFWCFYYMRKHGCYLFDLASPVERSCAVVLLYFVPTQHFRGYIPTGIFMTWI